MVSDTMTLWSLMRQQAPAKPSSRNLPASYSWYAAYISVPPSRFKINSPTIFPIVLSYGGGRITLRLMTRSGSTVDGIISRLLTAISARPSCRDVGDALTEREIGKSYSIVVGATRCEVVPTRALRLTPFNRPLYAVTLFTSSTKLTTTETYPINPSSS